jgi:Kef-type K+ transport system membrane component KefB
MNEILSVGLVLVAALLAGHLAQLARIPEVTGYLLVGLMIGPSGLDLVSHQNLETLGFLSEVALGLILFSIGMIFEAGHIARVGREAARITLWEALLAFGLVAVGLLALGQPLPIALLLGVIAMETAPATTLMVLHEYDARGPMTDRLLALVALNNMLVLTTYGLLATALSFGGADAWLSAVHRSVHGLLWSTLGSLALGILLGVLMDAWAGRAKESGESMILAIGFILLTVGAARQIGLSPLFASLALGATVANLSRRRDEMLATIGRADPPLYAAFFVLAGAELRLASLQGLGAVGLAYVLLRSAGKLGGAWMALRASTMPQVRANLGLCLISSSSLAVGLTLQVRRSFPDLAGTVAGVVLAAVLIFEIVGPWLTRRALLRSGEAQTRPRPLKMEAEKNPRVEESLP